MPKPFPMTRRGYLLVQQHPPRTSPVRWGRCRLLLSYGTLLYRGPPIEQLPDFFFWSTANQRAEDTACLVNCSFCVSSLLFLWDFVGFGRDKYTYARDTPFMCFSSSFPFGLHQIEEHDSASKFKAPTRILALASSFLNCSLDSTFFICNDERASSNTIYLRFFFSDHSPTVQYLLVNLPMAKSIEFNSFETNIHSQIWFFSFPSLFVFLFGKSEYKCEPLVLIFFLMPLIWAVSVWCSYGLIWAHIG